MVKIIAVQGRKGLKRFIHFNYRLYKGNPYAVPELYFDLERTLNPKKNAAFEFCQVIYFIAVKDGKDVGRIAGIVNEHANQRWNEKTVRFGWIDFVEDIEVAQALLKAVEDWGREKGMDKIEGPLGFADFDREGMLTEGFDQQSTIATPYNPPFYPRYMEQLGYQVGNKWIEMRLTVPDQLPASYDKIANFVMDRYNLRFVEFNNKKELVRDWGHKIFEVFNRAYVDVYGYYSLSEKQIEQYIKQYMGLVDKRMISLIVNEKNELVGAGIAMPSLSDACQKANGRLFPFGWWHLLKALYLKHSKVFDLLLLGVVPEYQNMGVNAMLLASVGKNIQQMGFKFGETNLEMETNSQVIAMWKAVDRKIHKRRCTFIKQL